ncbi:hypothetical protein ABUW04_27280 [Streptacidiphilus sp. N1-10]|uniref:Uncharacterized protein n=1 Tax=Streptacidiphilus jeojiensis TaxID=3229225 RepID=A0ABV6XUY0_9ACTN
MTQGVLPRVLPFADRSVAGSLQIVGSSGFVQIGGPDGSGCAADRIAGSVELRADQGGVDLVGNRIGGTLDCAANTPPPGNEGKPNTVTGPRTEQCALL